MSRTIKRPYRKSRAFATSCRSHGGCPWCEGNRTHATAKRLLSAEEQEAANHLRDIETERHLEAAYDA